MKKWFAFLLAGLLVVGYTPFISAQEEEVTEDEVMVECVKMLQEDEGLSLEEATSECEEMLQEDAEAADEAVDGETEPAY